MPLNSYSYTSAGMAEVSRLMVAVGRSVNMQYTDTASAPYSNLTFITGNGIKSFGYTSATGAVYNNSTSYPTVVSNLNLHEPVILSGATNVDGHEWVCDGYLQVSQTWCPSGSTPGGGQTMLYFNMNWGWNEAPVPNHTSWPDVDGWYFFNQWAVKNGNTVENFSQDLQFTYNIHP